MNENESTCVSYRKDCRGRFGGVRGALRGSDRKTFQVLTSKRCSKPGPLASYSGDGESQGFLYVRSALGLASHLTHVIE